MNYIVKDENALYYEVGYSCDNAILLRAGDDRFFVTDPRYTVEANEHIKNAKVVESYNLIYTIKDLINKNRVPNITFNPFEINVYEFDIIKDSYAELNPKKDFHKILRIIKNKKEIHLLKKASQIGKESFDKFSHTIKHLNKKDEKSLEYRLKDTLSNQGRYKLSFDPIVAINENSAKPHSIPTKKILKNGDLLLIDAGIKYKRYCSDRTATSYYNNKIDFDREQFFADKKMQKVYDIVRKAQETTISSIKVGMSAKKVDKIARDIISDAGFGKHFVHSTGHGVGLDIHEYPIISSKSDTKIEENMVFTVEPGIYLPDEFGVRIEDTVVIKNGKAEVL